MNKENDYSRLRELVHQGVPIGASEPETPPSTHNPEPAKCQKRTKGDYRATFLARVVITHRKPLYITAQTHRRLMRLVHCVEGATISSYVENIVLHHLDTFRSEIDNLYNTNNINPTQE